MFKALGATRLPVYWAPGSLGDGHYAVADLHTVDVELEQLGVTA